MATIYLLKAEGERSLAYTCKDLAILNGDKFGKTYEIEPIEHNDTEYLNVECTDILEVMITDEYGDQFPISYKTKEEEHSEGGECLGKYYHSLVDYDVNSKVSDELKKEIELIINCFLDEYKP